MKKRKITPEWVELPRDVWLIIYGFAYSDTRALLSLRLTCTLLAKIGETFIERSGRNVIRREFSITNESFQILDVSKIEFKFTSVFFHGASLETMSTFLGIWGSTCESVGATVHTDQLMKLIIGCCPNLAVFRHQEWLHVGLDVLTLFALTMKNLRRIVCLSDILPDQAMAMERLILNNPRLESVVSFSDKRDINELMDRLGASGGKIRRLMGNGGLRRWTFEK